MGLTTKLESFGGKQELLGSRRKAGNPELHPLHPLLHPEHQRGHSCRHNLNSCRHDLNSCRPAVPKQPKKCSGKPSSVDTTPSSVDTLPQFDPESAGKLIYIVSTPLDLVSTLPLPDFCIFWVVMRNQWSPMGQGKSDEHPPYE
ncbi:hypothetical protein Taro_005158 [Colocasia esculenta]|uniref:Uncharacterized protein n=1 Tax=Colocasia esculenta TaxID=4460 RepID=A0A843TTT0_COLES|nr:hypothetical protein [Colocasia esculenta]